MVNFAVPNITIPFDLLSNEQREAIYLIMTGDGFRNPLKEKIIKAKEIVVNEINLVSNIQIHPYSQTLLTEQQLTLVDYHLNLIVFWLNALEIHSDKLSGNESEYVGDMMQRLSVAGLYTKTMKSITGMDQEQYSLIFGSLTSLGESVIDDLRKLTFCEGSSNFCEIDTSGSGVEGIAHAIEIYPSTVDSMNQCLFPKIIEKLKNLIDTDEENFCKARRIIERYSYGTKIISSLENDPIFGEAIKNVFATPELKQALIAIRDSQNTILESDEILKTDKFFPEFDIGGTFDCLVEDQLINYGIKGQTGSIGGRGATGSPGIPGPVGDCNCGASGSPGGGAGGNCDCSQGGDSTGCCCVCDGYGVQATEFQCQHYGGVWYGEGSDCASVPCTPTGVCVGDDDCAIGEICCGAQCLQECALGGCPPCPTCVEGYSQCGTECCQDGDDSIGLIGQICCGDTCKTPCLEGTNMGGCPDCQGICCPNSTSCCGGDGCCPDGACCNGECCPAATQNTSCGNVDDCYCCPVGNDGNSMCCSVGSGTECCEQLLDSQGTMVWPVCCGAAGCCEEAKCCNGVCCEENYICCQDDYGNHECIPDEGYQCNCNEGTTECQDYGDGSLLCCIDDVEECCTSPTDGSKFCCEGECCGDDCCLGTCQEGKCCGVIEGYDYGENDPPNCHTCLHPTGGTNMCFCQVNGQWDWDCESCPHCSCAYDNVDPDCQNMDTYGSACFCPPGMSLDFDTCDCFCQDSDRPCESPWSPDGAANEYDSCWDVGGYCCESSSGGDNCCGHQGGIKLCYDSGPTDEICCEAGGQGPDDIECGQDTGNWLCNNGSPPETCCGGWRQWNPDFPYDEWEVIGECCGDGEYCFSYPAATTYAEDGVTFIWKGLWVCCASEGNSVDGGPLYGCIPSVWSDPAACKACPCEEVEVIASTGESVCCPSHTTHACVDDGGGVTCWQTEDETEDDYYPYAQCCTNDHTESVVWGEFGCCDTQNLKENWIAWNSGITIIREFPRGTEERDGCPCGCEHIATTGGGLYNSLADLGDGCQVACPEVLSGVGRGHSYIDFRCSEERKKTPGDVCECRTFDETVDCGQNGYFDDCCCDPEDTHTVGLAKSWYLDCRGNIVEHWNSCAAEGLPGEIWCHQCDGGIGDDDCEVCCYPEPGIVCDSINKNEIPCNHHCLGNVGFSNAGIYECGNNPAEFGTASSCTYGCENGLRTCNKYTPKYDGGEYCTSDCLECADRARSTGGGNRVPTSGSCWFDYNCSSFDSIDDGMRMNIGGKGKLIKSPEQSCKELGGEWYSDKSCDDFIPLQSRIIIENSAVTNTSFDPSKESRKTALQHGWGNLLKKYPNKNIDDIIGAKKKYTPEFDASGNLIKNKVELIFNDGPVGGQSELSTPNTVTQTVTSHPLQFQIVNFIADTKRKTNTRTISNVKDTKSKISEAELRDEEALGQENFEDNNAETIIVKGELTAAITNDGTIGEGLLISFVSGSNIKLSTNESNNIIKISVDDLYLDELVDVSDNEPQINDVLQWRVPIGGSTGQWTPVSPNVGITGPTGPIGGSDKHILFNEDGAASGSDNLKYDYETNTLEINSSVEFGSGFTFSGGIANIQNNTITKPKFNNYSETVYNIGNVTGSSVIIDVNNGNIQTLTKYVANGSIVSGSFYNAGTGSVTMTLIMTDAGTGDGFTFPSAIWAGGNVPSYSAIGTDIVTFNTIDGGTSWYGFVGGLGFTG